MTRGESARAARLTASVLAGTLLCPVASTGLVIVRWGGASEPPAADAEFVQVAWTDLHADRGGEAFQLAIDSQAIAARRLDPQEDLGPGILSRGGVFLKEVYGAAFDGDAQTAWVPALYECTGHLVFSCDDVYGLQGTVAVDLGGMYLLDRIRLVSGVDDPTYVVRDFRIHVAPEVPRERLDTRGQTQPFRPVAAEVRDNRDPVRDVFLPAGERVRFLQVAVGAHRLPWAIHQIGIYARGFLERSTFTSDVVDFGAPAVWGLLRWQGSKGPRSIVSVQTRAGRTADPNLYWRYTGRGGEKVPVRRAEYEGLVFALQAGTTLDRANWTPWSSYDFADSAGAPVASAGPRRYFQLRVEFRPAAEDAEESEVRAVELRASPPAVTDLTGEAWPLRAVAGESTQFTYVLRPVIGARDPGFDRLELTSPSLLESVAAVRLGDAAIAFALTAQEPHRIELTVPRLGPGDSGTLLELDFRARVLRYGAPFEARVWDSLRPLEVAQRVSPGDATDQFEGDGVAVVTAGRERLLQARVTTAVFTPNGDGANDEACIGYDVLEVAGAVPVRVQVSDLSGRPVRQLYRGRDGTGSYRRCWDGRDDSGRLVPPGLYLHRVTLDADGGQVSRVGVLGISY